MKKFVLILLISIVSVSLFAENEPPENNNVSIGQQISSEKIKLKYTPNPKDSTEGIENPFAGMWKLYLQIFVGIVGGTAMLLRFAFELTSAVVYSGEDSVDEVKKVLVRFILHVGVVVLAFILLSFVF